MIPNIDIEGLINQLQSLLESQNIQDVKINELEGSQNIQDVKINELEGSQNIQDVKINELEQGQTIQDLEIDNLTSTTTKKITQLETLTSIVPVLTMNDNIQDTKLTNIENELTTINQNITTIETNIPTTTMTPQQELKLDQILENSNNCDQKMDDCCNKMNDVMEQTVKVYKLKEDTESGDIIEDDPVTIDFKLAPEIISFNQLQLNKKKNILTNPDSFVMKPGAFPQLVVMIREVLENGKLGKATYSFCIPHYFKPQGYKPSIPSFQKGRYRCVLELDDNSKIVINAISEVEGQKVITSLKNFIDPRFTRNCILRPASKDPRELKICRVKAIRGDFYSQGDKTNLPDWSINF
jgi:hypothetical protein